MLFQFGSYEYITGTVITDAAAIALLLCIYANTADYRERGYLPDKIFHILIIMNMVSAFLDGFNSILEVNPVMTNGSRFLLILGHTIYYCVFGLCCYFMTLYLFSLRKNEMFVQKYWMVTGIPFLALGIMLIINLFTGVLFSIDVNTGILKNAQLYLIVKIILYMYIVIGLAEIFLIKKRLVIVACILVLSKIALSRTLYLVSVESFIFAIGLVLAHICMMNKAFFEEVKS